MGGQVMSKIGFWNDKEDDEVGVDNAGEGEKGGGEADGLLKAT
jgi:hypothetical protein